jgi:DNA (cytosine-5)-methyltransferase 1
MENVPNIVKARTQLGQLVVEIIRRELEKLDYHVYSTLLEAVNFGVPQIRKRFFVIASKNALERPFPTPTHIVSEAGPQESLFGHSLLPTPTLWEAISDLPLIAKRALYRSRGVVEAYKRSEPLQE